MTRATASLQPLYLQVKRHILDNIGSGKWSASMRVPSENDIVKSFGVSRMTANRALRELRDEGVLVRIAGVGSFVADLAFRTHKIPAWGETVLGSDFQLGPGGKGSNQAVAAARLGRANGPRPTPLPGSGARAVSGSAPR